MDQNEPNDEERESIRSELSKLSFAELQKLKSKLGSKVYNEAYFGSKKEFPQKFSRANKNRPREVSSKKKPPPSTVNIQLPKLTTENPRDPRFDSICGDYNLLSFAQDYSFLEEIQEKEISELKRALREETDENEKRKIQTTLQRLTNRRREKQKRKEKQFKAAEERNAKLNDIMEGKKVHFRSKFESKISGLLDQYSELKKSGKLKKHIERQRKKTKRKDKQKGLLFD